MTGIFAVLIVSSKSVMPNGCILFQTPAGIKVQVHWAKVEPLVSSGVNILSSFLAGFGMLIYLKFFLNTNWRLILVLVVGIHITFELPVVTLTGMKK